MNGCNYSCHIVKQDILHEKLHGYECFCAFNTTTFKQKLLQLGLQNKHGTFKKGGLQLLSPKYPLNFLEANKDHLI